MADRNKYTKDIEERANRARAINLANRNRAISYLRSAPSLLNLVNAARYYWLSNPHLGGENEQGADTGIAPVVGRGVRFKNGPSGEFYNSTISNLKTGATRRLNPLPRTGRKSISKPKPADVIKEQEGTLDFKMPWNYEAATRFGGTPNQWKAGAAAAATAGAVTAGVPYLNKYTDKAVDRYFNNNSDKGNASRVKTNTTSTTIRTANSTLANNTAGKNKPATSSTDTASQTTNTTSTFSTAAKPSTTAALTNNTSPQKQTTAPATRRTNATRRPARLANRNESTVNGNAVKVKAGDTLYDIAKRLTGDGNNYKEFLKYNNIKDANKIYAGDNLVIPEKFRKIKSNAERRNAAHQAKQLRRVKERINFTLPDNLDEDYAQLQPREGGRRTLETAGRF